MKIFVYFNLHKKCWSLRAMDGPRKGRVIAHKDEVLLENCQFKISEKMRQRVIAEKRRWVHAGIVGEVAPITGAFNAAAARQISYNPYKGPSFYDVTDQQPVTESPGRVYFTRDRRVFAELTT